MISLNERLSLLQKAFGKCTLSRDSANVAMRCVNPECGSRSDTSKLKLVVKLDDELYHCWVCGIKGRSMLPLFQKYAPAHINRARDIFSKTNLKTISVDEVAQEVELPDGFLLLAGNLHSRDPDVRAIFRYLSSRNITERDLWQFKLGTSKSGRCRRRVIFPSIDIEGKINFWVARTIDEDRKPKYLNSKTAKKLVVFNEADLDFKKQLTIVEGPFDLVRCDDNTTCILGSSLSKSHALFHECARNLTPILLALDADMQQKTQKIASLLYSAGCSVKILPLGCYSDVGEMTKDQFLAQKKLAYDWNPIDSLHQKISAIKSGSII
mgnify:FL=1|tara:strand:+ start:2282 stop:3253 length:972 start_codon:yes stop_codon:yes gene_type:complete